jgi:opacity protein-like surface antigen
VKPLRVLLAFLVAVLSASASLAQAPPPRPSEWLAGGGFLLGIPLGEFADATDTSYGLVGHVVFTPGGGSFGVRLQAGGLVYGSRSVETTVPGTGGLVTEDLTVDNSLVNAGLGPQVMARSGPVRPYAYALAGLGYFTTSTTLGGYHPTYGTTNYDDTTFAWAAGAGLLVPVSRSVSLDLSVQYVANGTVRYLAEGDLAPTPGGNPPAVVPRKTDANLVTVTLGVVFGQ